MARGNFREYLRGDTVWLKKYFYVLRPLAAILWIEQGLGPVPIEFHKLVAATIRDSRIREAIDHLVAAKLSGEELRRGPRIEVLSRFIESELERLESTAMPTETSEPSLDVLNELFRGVVNEAWAPLQSV
jgi:hypothetical protein